MIGVKKRLQLTRLCPAGEIKKGSVVSIEQTYCGNYTAEGQRRSIPLRVSPFAVKHVKYG